MDVITVPTVFMDIALRLVVATALGGAIGIDREIAQKPAGLRTHALVALGSCLLTIISLLLVTGDPGDEAAPGRVMQGLVAGIGFIGGGAILRSHDTKDVYGLTTAASVWMVAAVGIAVGGGLWRTSAVAVALVLLTLVFGERADRLLHRMRRRPDNRTSGKRRTEQDTDDERDHQ